MLSTAVERTVDAGVTFPMTEVNNAGILWDKACGILVEQVSDAVWSNTFKDIRALYLDENVLTIEVPSAFIRDRIEHSLHRFCQSTVGKPLNTVG